jgi:ATP-dependent protease ClpP protease subunit
MKATKEIAQHAEGIIKIIKLKGEVVEDETLNDLIKQAGDISNFDTLVVEIASPGGSVSEGLSIMIWLEHLSKHGKKIVTVVTANAYSIASLIMLVADIKLISKHAKVMIHNPMVPLLEYVNANDLQEYIDSLRSLEDTMYQLYQFFTGLDKEQIKLLMDNETYLLPQEAVDSGFADLVIDIKPKSYEMASNTKKEINMSSTLNILNKVIGMVNKSEFINQLYSDLHGEQLEIYQNDPSTYKVGDRTSLENGEVSLSDGATLTIVDGVITVIDRSVAPAVDPIAPAVDPIAPAVDPIAPAVDPVAPVAPAVDPVDPVAPAVDPVAPAVDPVAPVAPAVDPVDPVAPAVDPVDPVDPAVDPIVPIVELAGAQFNVGPAPKMEDPKMEDPKMEDPKMEDHKMEDHKMDYIKAMEVSEEHMNQMHMTLQAMEQRIAKLEAICMGYDARFLDMSKFEDIATEAIDTLAMNAVSNFKPDAITPSIAVARGKGSIFNQQKAKRNL